MPDHDNTNSKVADNCRRRLISMVAGTATTFNGEEDLTILTETSELEFECKHCPITSQRISMRNISWNRGIHRNTRRNCQSTKERLRFLFCLQEEKVSSPK